MGVNPLEPPPASSSPAAAAIWWAGPAIGAMNLIPVLPLDGGNIVTYGLDRLVPGRARRYMLYFSIAATLAGAVVLVGTGYRGFVLFIGFLLITQLQMLNAGKPQKAPRSAWEAAAEALHAGKPGKARRMLLAALSHPQPTAAVPDLAVTPADASALIDLLPDPLPHGDPGNEYVLANLLLTTRRYDEAAHYAAGSFERYPNTLSAAIVARAAAALGDQATAIGWLQSAADAGTSAVGSRHHDRPGARAHRRADAPRRGHDPPLPRSHHLRFLLTETTQRFVGAGTEQITRTICRCRDRANRCVRDGGIR